MVDMRRGVIDRGARMNSKRGVCVLRQDLGLSANRKQKVIRESLVCERLVRESMANSTVVGLDVQMGSKVPSKRCRGQWASKVREQLQRM